MDAKGGAAPLRLLANLDTAQDADQGSHRTSFRLPRYGKEELDSGASGGMGRDSRTPRSSTSDAAPASHSASVQPTQRIADRSI